MRPAALPLSEVQRAPHVVHSPLSLGSLLTPPFTTQGLLRLVEPEVEITARSADVQLVQEASSAASQQYKEKSGRDVKVSVVEGLGKDSSGGIILAGHEGRIKVNNTLDERLRLAEDKVSRRCSAVSAESTQLTRLLSYTDATRDRSRPIRREPKPQVLQLSCSLSSSSRTPLLPSIVLSPLPLSLPARRKLRVYIDPPLR